MSSQNYKDKLDQFINENNEIKFATLEGENTHERIANHFNTLRELLQLSGLQEVLEIGNTTEAGTTLRAIGGIQIENFLKVSSNIGTAAPEDPIDYILAIQPDGMVVLKLIDEILENIIEKLPPDDPEAEFLLRADGTRIDQTAVGGYTEIVNQFNDLNGDVDLDLITEEGTYVLKDARDQNLNDLPHYGGDGPVNVQIDVFITDNYTMQRAIYYTITNGIPTMAYRIKYLNDSEYEEWVDAYKEDYNGVARNSTSNIAASYNIYLRSTTQHYNLTMTDDTDINFLEMITASETKVITITLSGDYAFTLPPWLKPLETNDEYDTIEGTLVAEIVINIKNGGASPQGYYSLQMIDYAS